MVSRIAVVDDHPLFRAGIVWTMKQSEYFDVVAEGASASDAIAIARDLKPDALLLDINMPGSGIEAAMQISIANPSVKVVMVTVCEIFESVSACLEAGVKGYILKGASGEELVRVVRAVCEGEAYVTPQLAARLLTDRKPQAKDVKSLGPISELTPRETDVLAQVALGRTNKQVARALSLSEKTVKHYMSSVMNKLQVRSRLEAAIYYREKA